MKTIEVVAALIHRDGLWYATQRGYGRFEGLWEFPGGKIEPGEKPEEALRREIREELEVEIDVGDLLCTVEYDYPDFHLSMRCFLCTLPNVRQSDPTEETGSDNRQPDLTRETASESRQPDLTRETGSDSGKADRSGETVIPRLVEAKSARWMLPQEMPSLEWLPADWQIIPLLK